MRYSILVGVIFGWMLGCTPTTAQLKVNTAAEQKIAWSLSLAGLKGDSQNFAVEAARAEWETLIERAILECSQATTVLDAAIAQEVQGISSKKNLSALITGGVSLLGGIATAVLANRIKGDENNNDVSGKGETLISALVTGITSFTGGALTVFIVGSDEVLKNKGKLRDEVIQKKDDLIASCTPLTDENRAACRAKALDLIGKCGA